MEKLSLFKLYQPWHEELININKQYKANNEAVICVIDGEYGSGKSVLVEQWMESIKEQQLDGLSALFSAWQTDSNDQPLIDILTAIMQSTQQNPNIVLPMEKLKETLANILVTTTSIVASDKAAEAVEKMTDKILKPKEKSDKEILKELLQKTVANDGKPFFIFIDELDRAKPTYVLKLIEELKHLFNIPNIIFVLVMNKNHLAQTIESQYGYKEGGGILYLERLFNKSYHIDKDEVMRYLIKNYIEEELGQTAEHQRFFKIDDEFYSRMTYDEIKGRTMIAIPISLLERKNALSRNDPVFDPDPFNEYNLTEIRFEIDFSTFFYSCCLYYNLNLREVEKLLIEINHVKPRPDFGNWYKGGWHNSNHYDKAPHIIDAFVVLFLAVKIKHWERFVIFKEQCSKEGETILFYLLSNPSIWNSLIENNPTHVMFNTISILCGAEPFQTVEDMKNHSEKLYNHYTGLLEYQANNLIPRQSCFPLIKLLINNQELESTLQKIVFNKGLDS